MSQGDACTRINHDKLVRLAGKNQAAEVAGNEGLQDVGQKRDQAGLGAERLGDVGGAHITSSEIPDILRNFMPRNQISGLKTAKEIADENTDDAEHFSSPF